MNYKKIEKTCPVIGNFNIKPSLDLTKGVCLEAVYQFSLLVQNLSQDLIKGNLAEVSADIQKLISELPDTLDTCGDHTMADKIRKDFPPECLRAFSSLAKELVLVEHNFDHLEWLAKHWKEFRLSLIEVKMSCPFVL